MGLITNSKSSLYGGVNQQSAEHRLETQVEECINAYPTVNQGLLRRNPTDRLPLSDYVPFTKDSYVYMYDRGLAGDAEEKYSILINSYGMYIINTVTGKVYSKENGLLKFDSEDEEAYLRPFTNSNGYSAVTIKDTTFIVNKSKQVILDPYVFASEEDAQVVTRDIWYDVETFADFITTTPKDSSAVFTAVGSDQVSQRDLFPSSVYMTSSSWYEIEYIGVVTNMDVYATGCTTTVTIDGTIVQYDVPTSKIGEAVVDPYDNVGATIDSIPITYDEWLTNLYTKIVEALDPAKYSVGLYNPYGIASTSKVIRIDRLDGVEPVVSITISFDDIPTDNTSVIYTSLSSDYYFGGTTAQTTATITIPSVTYTNTCFFWIKASEPTVGYTYTYSISDGVNSIGGSVTELTTEAAASALAADINAKALGFTATASGSFVKVVSDNGDITSLSISDTYGNQASFAWGIEVNSMYDLPKSFPFFSIVKVINTDVQEDSGYWLKYEGGIWRECLGFNVQPKIDPYSMPHILVRNSDDTFSFRKYDKWQDMKVGDSESNEYPSFINSTIKDIFFFKNRLGFITSTSCVMSEVGNYGNFFRTSVVVLLDGDRIDTTVDTTKAISLEFATYLEDSLMLFSDKAQFKLEGGNILSPSNVQISQTSAYEINKNVRPIFSNNKLFFCAKRGNNTAVMQYFVDGNGRVSDAIDITSHVETYIPEDVRFMSASPINNMLFLFAPSTSDTLYVYKYLDDGDSRIQSAWFKWKYRGLIYSSFCLGKNLNLMIERVDTADSSITYKQFETQLIHPLPFTDIKFVDDSHLEAIPGTVDYVVKTASSSPLTISCNIPVTYDIVIEEINGSGGVRGWTVAMSDGEILTATDSVITIPRSPIRQIVSITVDMATEAEGYIFNGLTAHYAWDTTPLLYNGDFSFGLDRWLFIDWDIVEKQEEKGYTIDTSVSLGEWVMKSGNNSLPEGTLQFKSLQINSEEGSDFYVVVEDIQRGTSRTIGSKYTVGRKPMIYGNAKNIRVHINSESYKGFKINSVTLEGNYNTRSRRA